jgi:hypothetical protein
MWLSTIFMDRFLEGFDRILGFSHLSISVYLAFVFHYHPYSLVSLYLVSRIRILDLGKREGFPSTRLS